MEEGETRTDRGLHCQGSIKCGRTLNSAQIMKVNVMYMKLCCVRNPCSEHVYFVF